MKCISRLLAVGKSCGMEVKEAMREIKLSVWNVVAEKVNPDIEGSRKGFWAFVGR